MVFQCLKGFLLNWLNLKGSFISFSVLQMYKLFFTCTTKITKKCCTKSLHNCSISELLNIYKRERELHKERKRVEREREKREERKGDGGVARACVRACGWLWLL